MLSHSNSASPAPRYDAKQVNAAADMRMFLDSSDPFTAIVKLSPHLSLGVLSKDAEQSSVYRAMEKAGCSRSFLRECARFCTKQTPKPAARKLRGLRGASQKNTT